MSSLCGPLVDLFNSTAWAQHRVSDKVSDHRYELMYGLFLMPMLLLGRHAKHPPTAHKLKMLEIGLGCNMNYGPGASVQLWRNLFPHVEVWEAEYDANCVARSRARGLLNGINVLVGDQADRSTLRRWVNESGGEFDVIIDDGGHSNRQILTSFEELWPHVRPGGLYFFEDLHVGRHPSASDPNVPIVSDVLQAWIEQLLIHQVGPRYRMNGDAHEYAKWVRSQRHDRGFAQARARALEHPLPEGVATVSCQPQACVVAKACRE